MKPRRFAPPSRTGCLCRDDSGREWLIKRRIFLVVFLSSPFMINNICTPMSVVGICPPDILSAFVLFSVSQSSNIVLENAFTSLSAPSKRLFTYAVFLSVGVDNKFYVP